MIKESLYTELKSVDEQIKKLTTRKHEIERQIISFIDISFEEKFKVWIESGTGKHEPYLLRPENYPVLAPYVREWDLQRHRTYDLLEMFEDEIFFLLNPEERQSSGVSEKKMDDFKVIAKEMIEKNIVSFTCDW